MWKYIENYGMLLINVFAIALLGGVLGGVVVIICGGGR